MDNLAGTDAEMFALLVEAWVGEPGSWTDFPGYPGARTDHLRRERGAHAARHARLAAQALPHGTDRIFM